MDDKDKLAPQTALDAMAVAPPPDPAPGDEDHAGRDPAIDRRLQDAPRDEDARLDEALDETMDASDPPSITQPRKHSPLPDPSAAERSG